MPIRITGLNSGLDTEAIISALHPLLIQRNDLLVNDFNLISQL